MRLGARIEVDEGPDRGDNEVQQLKAASGIGSSILIAQTLSSASSIWGVTRLQGGYMLLAQGCRSIIRALAVCLIMTFVLSCSSLRGGSKNSEGLLAAAQDLNNAIRWQDYKTASVIVAPTLQDDFWDLADELHKSVRIMDFETRNSSVDESGQSGVVVLHYRLYYTNSPQVYTKTIHQRYCYSSKDQGWQLVEHDLQGLLP